MWHLPTKPALHPTKPALHRTRARVSADNARNPPKRHICHRAHARAVIPNWVLTKTTVRPPSASATADVAQRLSSPRHPSR